jgi:hypothetical protein
MVICHDGAERRLNKPMPRLTKGVCKEVLELMQGERERQTPAVV